MSLSRRLPVALIALAACTPYRPPFTQESSVPPPIAAPTGTHLASLVFLWPMTSCDPAGYFTLATADGRFLGNISRGTRLAVQVPVGQSTIVGWDDVMESPRGRMAEDTVPVLHAHLDEGRTYYVRMAFGEWDAAGPRNPWAGIRYRPLNRACVTGRNGMSSAMVSLTPRSKEWSALPDWMASLDPIAPDHAAGQAWLDENRAVLEAHLAVARDRFVGLRPDARRLATLEPVDAEP